MSDLNVDISNKADWPTKSIDSLCTLISRGSAPVYVEHSNVLAIGQRCVASTGFNPDLARPHSQRAMRNVLRPELGDVLLNSTGTGTIGRSVIFNTSGNFIVDGHVTVLRPDAERAESIWLNSVLRTPWFQNHLERFCYAGSTNQLELSRTPLRTSSLPVPSVDEQRAMGLVLNTLDIAIQETEAIIAKLRAVKQGILHDLLTRGIGANGELRPPQAEAPHLYKPSPLGWIPTEWEVPTLAELLVGIDAGWSPSCPEEPPRAGEWGVLKVSAVSSGVYNPGESKRLPPELKPIRSMEVKTGDVLLARANGVANLVATTVLVSDTPSCLMLSDKTLRLVPGQKLMAGHLARVMRHDVVRTQINGMLNGSSGQKNISQEQIRNIRIPLPPFEEQAISDTQATESAEQISAEQCSLMKLGALKSSLMDDLLTGRVRVTPLLANVRQQKGRT